jgi:hypothetical protein
MERDDKDRRDIDRRDGTIIVRTNPSGAIVTVEGESKTTPAIFVVEGRELPYDIHIKMDGYDGYTQIVVVPKESEIMIDIALAKERC